MAYHGTYYYVEDLQVGDLARCRKGRAWVLLLDNRTIELLELDGTVALHLGSVGEEMYFLIDGQVRQLCDSHNELTRWEILGGSN